jgi:hypothetical protein
MGFWKKLGKIAAFAAPIVAAPFTGGLSLAAIGAGAGAASAAMDHKGLKGMLLNAGLGAIPGVGKAATAGKGLSTAAKLAIKTGLGAAGGAATGGAKGALLGGGLAAAGSKFGGAGNAAGGEVAENSGGSLMHKLLDSGKTALIGKGDGDSGLLQQLLSGDSLHAAGQGLGAVAQSQAHNRGVALDAMMEGDQNAMALARDRRADESDMMRKMQQLAYIKGGGFHDTGDATGASGKFTKFDFGTRGSAPESMQMAGELENQLMDRLHNPMKLRDYDSKMNPSKTETALDWLSPVLTTVGVARGAGKYQGPLAGGKKSVAGTPATAQATPGSFGAPGDFLPPEQQPPQPVMPGTPYSIQDLLQGL